MHVGSGPLTLLGVGAGIDGMVPMGGKDRKLEVELDEPQGNGGYVAGCSCGGNI